MDKVIDDLREQMGGQARRKGEDEKQKKGAEKIVLGGGKGKKGSCVSGKLNKFGNREKIPPPGKECEEGGD